MAYGRAEDETDIFDVDDGPMLRKRERVMNVCILQVLLSTALVVNMRRAPVLVVLYPFFIAAGILGYLGAKKSSAMMLMAHFLGSAGLSIVFMIFVLATAFLQRSGTDLMFFALNFPMDLFLLTTSVFSVILWLSLKRFKRQLRIRRQQIRENFEATGQQLVEHGWNSSSVRPSPEATHSRNLRADLQCPITLEVMRDPVIAGDGHSYEREAIERWLQGHRTSPLTGRALPHANLIPNHSLRGLIEELRNAPSANLSNLHSARAGGIAMSGIAMGSTAAPVAQARGGEEEDESTLLPAA